MKRPSFQFYPSDWQGNSNLRRCTHAEKGVWLDVMCLMHDSEEYGVLRWSLKEIAKAVGCKASEIKALITKGVLKGCDSGECEPFVYTPRSGRKDGNPVTLIIPQAGPIWYSSRMVRDEHVRTIRGESTRFGADNDDAPKAAPKPPFGDGSTSSSSSSGKPTSSLRSEGAESAEKKSAPPSANETEDSLLAAIFEVGLPVMRDGGCSEKSARSLLGKLRKELGDLEALVAVEAMGREKPLDAAAWVAAAIKSRQTAAVSLGEFMAGCRERKEPVVSGYAPIFEYAEQAGIPGEFVELAWGEFKRRHMPGGIWESARREDWRRSFLAALQTNALRLWYFDAKTQSFLLTTVGMQADIAGRAAA